MQVRQANDQRPPSRSLDLGNHSVSPQTPASERSEETGRVTQGGYPARVPTDPDLPVDEASGSSSHDFAALLTEPWTTRRGEDCIAPPGERIWTTTLVCLGGAETATVARSRVQPPGIPGREA